MKYELGGNLMTGIAALRPKTYSYLRDHNDEKKGTEKRLIERKYNFFYYNYCLEANRHKNKMNQLHENKLDVDSLREVHKGFIKSNKLILKSQQRFRSKNHKKNF